MDTEDLEGMLRGMESGTSMTFYDSCDDGHLTCIFGDDDSCPACEAMERERERDDLHDECWHDETVSAARDALAQLVEDLETQGFPNAGQDPEGIIAKIHSAWDGFGSL
jgi:hypothetical protein